MAKSGGRVKSQPPRGATTPSRDQESQKAEMGVGQQANIPKHVGGSWSPSLGHRASFKIELPCLAGGGAAQTELQLKGSTSATW
jgi:hypothetical protein